MNHVFCLRWGDMYTKDYTDHLYKNLKENLSVDFEFHEFTDKDFDSESDEWEQTSEFFTQMRDHRHYTFDDKRDHGGLSHYKKILMMKDNFGINEGNFLYLDLDTHINRNIDWIFDLDNSKPWAIKNHWFAGERFRKNFPIHRSPMINSSVIKWTDNQLKPIYDYTKKHLGKVMFTYNAIDNYIQDQFCGFHNGKPHFFNFFEKGKIVNFSEVSEQELENSDITFFAGLSIFEKDMMVHAIEAQLKEQGRGNTQLGMAPSQNVEQARCIQNATLEHIQEINARRSEHIQQIISFHKNEALSDD